MALYKVTKEHDEIEIGGRVFILKKLRHLSVKEAAALEELQEERAGDWTPDDTLSRLRYFIPDLDQETFDSLSIAELEQIMAIVSPEEAASGPTGSDPEPSPGSEPSEN